MATFDHHYNNQVKILDPKKKAEIKESDTLYENQKKAVTDNYNYQINEADKAYTDDYRENAIQKIVNERAVAENMANMGLRDSGLNRTQMTATQLSYGNNKAKIDRQKQAQVDALAQQLAATLSQIDINKSNAAASIRQGYDNLASQNATALANADTEAATEKYKADLEAIKKADNAAVTRQNELSKVKQTALEKYNAGGDKGLAALLDTLKLTDDELSEILAYIYGNGETEGYGEYEKKQSFKSGLSDIKNQIVNAIKRPVF